MPDGPAALPRAGRTRRAGDSVPTLRRVVEAVVDGHAVAWEQAERQGRTPLEQRMTRHLRELATLAGLPGGADLWPHRSPLHRAVVVVMCAVASQVIVGVAACAWLVADGHLHGWQGLAPVGLALLALMAWGSGRRATPSVADLLLVLAAWASRGALTTLADVSAWGAFLTAPWRVLHAEASLPFVLAAAAVARTSLARFTWRDRVARGFVWVALASSLALMPAPFTQWMPTALPAAAAASAVAALLVLACWRVVPPAQAHGSLSPAGWFVSARRVAHDVWAAWRGTPTTRLAALAASVHRARTPREIAADLRRHVLDVTGTRHAAVLVPGALVWDVLGGEASPLPADSALAALLDATDGAVRVHPAARTFAWLPQDDRRWLHEAGIVAVARLAAPEGQTLGGLVVGGRIDGRPLSHRDLACISAATGIAGAALAGVAAPLGARRAGPPVSDEVPYECEACGRLSPEPAPCACGGATGLAALPAVLHETFALERRIGRGGMGVVYRAHDSRLDRLVALKTLPALAPTAARALQAEARAMAAIEHPSVASLYGLESWKGTPVLVVEYLAGGTLAARVAAGPMRTGDAVALARILAESLATLHARGWVHGDIKPSNIGLTRDGAPKLLDFGLTRWREATSPSGQPPGASTSSDGTRQGLLAGTPLYLSPEALDGRPAGEADDVWALSLVIVELLTGVHPFRGAGVQAAAARARAQASIDVRRWAPSTPAWLAEALARALLPDRTRRLTSARALADALAPRGDAAAHADGTSPSTEARA